MTHGARRVPPLTVEEYLEIEEASTVKHEYVAGEVHALAGVTLRHNLISANILVALRASARGGPCRVFMADVKLRAAPDVVYYPDVMVSCGHEADGSAVVESPCLVVEVLSPGTATIDRREKLATYKRLPSLRAYLIVHQRRMRVERHWRDEEGLWWSADLVGPGDVPVPCPEVVLTTGEIYEGIAFDG